MRVNLHINVSRRQKKQNKKVFLSFPPVVADSSLRETPPWGQLGLSTAADGKGYFIKCTPEVWEEWEEEDVNLNTADCINTLSPSSFHVSFLQLKSKWQRYRHFRGQKKGEIWKQYYFSVMYSISYIFYWISSDVKANFHIFEGRCLVFACGWNDGGQK